MFGLISDKVGKCLKSVLIPKQVNIAIKSPACKWYYDVLSPPLVNIAIITVKVLKVG